MTLSNLGFIFPRVVIKLKLDFIYWVKG